jgi:hypothetical protein
MISINGLSSIPCRLYRIKRRVQIDETLSAAFQDVGGSIERLLCPSRLFPRCFNAAILIAAVVFFQALEDQGWGLAD